MDIQGYIADYWVSKVNDDAPVLTIYDPEGRYHELLPVAAEMGFDIVDTTCQTLNSFEYLAEVWERLKTKPAIRILIYRKRPMPIEVEEKLDEPFQAIAQAGVIFPHGANDAFLHICHRFLPTKTKEINLLERQGTLTFDNINNLQEGASYPGLETLTNGHSLQEIVMGLLKLETVTTLNWLQEWRRLVNTHFPGIDSTGSLTLQDVQDRMWQYLLFSEFVLDLPQQLPESLNSVACAGDSQKTSIYDITGRIRNSVDMRDYYLEAAEKIARSLELERLFANADNLGDIVTFAFENRVEFDHFVKLIEIRDIDGAKALAVKNKRGIWYSADRETQSFWELALTAVDLFNAIEGGIKAAETRDDLIEWYALSGYKADKAMRRFLTNFKLSAYHQPQATRLADLVGTAYRNYTERGVKVYQDLCVTENFHTSSIQRNDSTFNTFIKPLLTQGKRVVMFMVDAFRYEMGTEFVDSICNRFASVDCKPALAFIPTVTKYGMAALLPDASDELELKIDNDKLVPYVNGKLTETPDKRIERIKEAVGNVTVQNIALDEFTKERVNSDTQLLVIRSVKIDSAGENCGSQGLGTMDIEMRDLARALEEVRALEFNEAFLFADHGYMLQPGSLAGDKVVKPTGNDIVLSKVRCIAGNLNDSESSLTFSPEQLGINTTVPRFAFAKGFGVYESGQIYFHEGLSLQENIVPIVTVTLAKEKKKTVNATYRLSYKGKETGTVRIHRPMIEIEANIGSLFSEEKVRVKMQIRNAAGAEAGMPVESEYYDETSQILSIPCGETVKQPVELNEGIIGDILINLLDVDTNRTLTSLLLQTDLN